MTAFFVQEFKKTNKCLKCKTSKIEGYSLCAKHLRYAKLRWRTWAEDRKEAGKCCYCHRKSFNGWLRCRTHTAYNRKIGIEWCVRNKEYRAQYEKDTKQKWFGAGKCFLCPEHRKLTGDFKKCLTCRKVNRVGYNKEHTASI